MTLSEITQFVINKMNLIDSTSVSICSSFVRRRYQLVWDCFPWRDTQIINVAQSVIGGSNSVTLPATIDRVISIRAAGRFLDPVDATFLVQTDPTIFERSGPPSLYEEWVDAAGSDAHKIKVYPTPTVNTPLYIVGKRMRPELADGDSSIIRGIDNCLIAYAEHDMLERMRQYAKAKMKLEEADALLTAAKTLEMEQTNRPRRAKNLTAAGNSLGGNGGCGVCTVRHVRAG